MKPFNQPNLFEQPKWEIHVRENNPESQEALDNNRDKWSGKCELVYGLLMAGSELTTESAMVLYRVFSLPRRLLDLKLNGVKYSERKEGPIKIWFMCAEDRIENSKKFKS